MRDTNVCGLCVSGVLLSQKNVARMQQNVMKNGKKYEV